MSEYQTYDHERGWFRSDNRREPYFNTPDDEAFARAQAFAAIRRAAKVAREHDRWQASCLRRGKKHAAEEHLHTARETRRAIRAAIGSEKT